MLSKLSSTRQGRSVQQYADANKKLGSRGDFDRGIDSKKGRSTNNSELNANAASFLGSAKETGSGQKTTQKQVAAFERDRVVSNNIPLAQQNEIKNFSQAQQIDQTQATQGVELGTLSQSDKYDYLQKACIQQAGGDASAWKTKEGEVNLIAIRSYHDGRPGDNTPGSYDDTLYMVSIENNKKVVKSYNLSVDPGVSKPGAALDAFYDDQGNRVGVPHIADGFYRNVFTRGNVAGGDVGLRQQGIFRVNFDKNNDGIIQDSERVGDHAQGYYAGPRAQLQIHSGTDPDNVGTSSSGCQVMPPDDWARFQQDLAKVPPSQKDFSYLLMDSSKLPAIDSDFKPLPKNQIDQRTAFQNPHPDIEAGETYDSVLSQGIVDPNWRPIESEADLTYNYVDNKNVSYGLVPTDDNYGPGGGRIVQPKSKICLGLQSYFQEPVDLDMYRI